MVVTLLPRSTSPRSDVSRVTVKEGHFGIDIKRLIEVFEYSTSMISSFPRSSYHDARGARMIPPPVPSLGPSI